MTKVVAANMDKPFEFKQFTVHQDQCAMKIGTDSVLLGAWTPLAQQPKSALDIGAGTGVLALMMAQRCDAELIDAIEIDDIAFEQCVQNFELSPWSDRLFCYHASLQEFVDEIEEKYDLIVSNPPFYQDSFKSPSLQRDLARFTDAMPFKHLIESVSKLLSPNGQFNVIIPFMEEQGFVAMAQKSSLHPNKILRVKGSPTSGIKRSLIQFSFVASELDIDELVIETSRNHYTDAYIHLTKDFYLKM